MKKIISQLKRFNALVLAFPKKHPLISFGIATLLLLVYFITLCVVTAYYFPQYWDVYPDFGSCPNSCHCYFYFVMGLLLFPVFHIFYTFIYAAIATARNLIARKKDMPDC